MSLVYIGYVPHPPIIVPEIGRGEERFAEATINAYQKLAQNIMKTGTSNLLIVSPHAPLSTDGLSYFEGEYLNGDFRNFGAPQVNFKLEVDQTILEVIKREIKDAVPVNAELDHGVMVPVYYCQKAGWSGKVVVLGMPVNEPESYGRKIGQILNDSSERWALLASGDLSHRLKEDGPYGYHPSGPKVDSIIVKGLRKNSALIRSIPQKLLDEAAQCGYNSLLFALGAREGSIKVFSYEGPYGVGYLVAEIYRSSPIAGFARECLTYYLTAQPFDKLVVPGEPLLKEKKSCFVTLKKDGQLRGCIGTVQPVRENLAAEIKHNAIAAGTQDPRFWPVEAAELPLITVSVDVLGDLEKVSEYSQLDPQRYGVVVRHGGKVGLLLPHLEGVDTVEEQINIAKQKGAIYEDEGLELWRFEVQRYFE